MRWAGAEPVAAELAVETDSFDVLRGEGKKVAEAKITWKKGDVVQAYLPFTGEIDQLTTPDEVTIEPVESTSAA